MARISLLFAFVLACRTAPLAPSDDAGTEIDAATTADAGAPDANADAGPDDAASVDAASAEVSFLDPSSYADLLVLDVVLPFGVVARHAADADVLGFRWGRPGGPMVTTQV